MEERLAAYGELAVRVALNLQPGQRLLVIGPLMNGGASLEAAPLVRHIAASAYRAGSPLVEAIWGDEALQLARFQHAPRDGFSQFSSWLPDALAEHAEAGHAVLSVYANDPDLLQNQSAELAGSTGGGLFLFLFDELQVDAYYGVGWSTDSSKNTGLALVFKEAF